MKIALQSNEETGAILQIVCQFVPAEIQAFRFDKCFYQIAYLDWGKAGSS